MWVVLFKLTTTDGTFKKDPANVFQQNSYTSADSIFKGLLLKPKPCILRTNTLWEQSKWAICQFKIDL